MLVGKDKGKSCRGRGVQEKHPGLWMKVTGILKLTTGITGFIVLSGEEEIPDGIFRNRN